MSVELRVHGVTGASAESMLDRPLVRLVAGDEEAGFHRPRAEYGNTTGPTGAELEAYRWGNMTAGAAARALWLMLLPFMLANLAMWLRPAAGRGGSLLVRALCRLFALTITATFMLSFTGVALDLVAWQCDPTCTENRPLLAVLTTGFFAPTGRRLAVLSLLPLLAFGGLWWLGRRTWSHYEAFPVPETADGDGLASAGFWSGRALVGRLRALHIATAVGTLNAVLAGLLALREPYWPGYSLLAVTVVVLATCLVAICLPRMTSRNAPAPWAKGLGRGLRNAALILYPLTFVYAMLPRDPWPAKGPLPGFGLAVTIVFAGQLLLLLILGGIVFVQRERHGVLLAGLGTPIVASISLGVAVAFTAGLSFRVADVLDRAATPSPAGIAGRQNLEPPAAYQWAALGFAIMVLVIAVVAVVGRLTLVRRLRAEAAAVTDRDFSGRRMTDAGRARAIDAAIANARLTDHVGSLLLWAYLPLAAVATAVTWFALIGSAPVELAQPGSWAARVLSAATNLGTYLISVATIGLLVVGVLAYRYAGIRRVVGVFWDLGTFWPRAAHPLAPPCYAERVVPELVTRVTWLAETGPVVLSGHSQGSVLVAAAVLQMPPRLRDRLSLLTYGSPLGRLYARLFPAYVNPEVLAAVHEAVGGRWRNLWRDTDLIGGPVGRDADVRLRDPAAFDPRPWDTVAPPILAHSGYQHEPEFATCLRACTEG
jgi:hypothetical protein